MQSLKKSIPLWVVLLLLASSVGLAVAAVAPTLVELHILPYKEVPVLETDIQIISKSFKVTGKGIQSNTGSEEEPIDFSSPYASASTGATKGDYIYEFWVEETSATALEVGEKFKVDVYGDDALIGTIYIGQTAVPDPDVFEGVKHTVSVGKTIENIVIVITRLPIV